MGRAGSGIITEGFHYWIFFLMVLIIAGVSGLLVYQRWYFRELDESHLVEYLPGARLIRFENQYNHIAVEIREPDLYETDAQIGSAFISILENEREFLERPTLREVRFSIELRYPGTMSATGRLVQYTLIDAGPRFGTYYDLTFWEPYESDAMRLRRDRTYNDITPQKLQELANGNITTDDLTPGEAHHVVYD